MKRIVPFTVDQLIASATAKKVSGQVRSAVLRRGNQRGAALVVNRIDCGTSFEE